MLAVPAASAMASTGSSGGAHSAKAPSSYKDAQVLDFVLFGAGKLAKDHPAEAARVRHGRSLQTPDAAQLNKLVTALKSVDPKYHSRVTEAMESGDPFIAQSGAKALNQDISAVMRKAKVNGSNMRSGLVRANGFFWHDSNIVTEQNVAAVWQAGVYSTAAVAAGVAWVLYVTPAAASYQFEMNSANSIDRQAYTAAIVRAASSPS